MGILGFCSLAAGIARAQTSGFVQIPDSYTVQKPWNLQESDRFSVSNGVYTCWVFGTDQPFKQGSGTGPRTEMRWQTWTNQTTANQLAFDEMFSTGTSHTCVHQIKSDDKGDGSGGEALYLQVNEAGTLRNGTGTDFVSGIGGTWYHINSIYDPVKGTSELYYNGSLVHSGTGFVWPNGNWYFKTGVYDNGMPTNAEAWVQIKNVVHWLQQNSPDFSLSASPGSLTILQGANGTSTITVTPVNGFNSSVSLSASGLPSGVTASFNPASTTTTSTLTLTASSTATTGTATVTVTGTSGSLTHTTTISLTVNPGVSFAGIYQIQNEASGLVLNNQGSLTNGSPITQWTVTTSSNLDWTFIPTSNGYYQINSSKSGLDAVVQSASTAAGAKIIQWSFGSSGNDQWKPNANADGSYTFVNLHSGLVLGDPGSSTSTSTQMDQETSNGGSNQKWKLLKQ